MTRKDFELIAAVIADAGTDGEKCHPVRMSVLQEIADMFARELQSENPRFNRERFLDACNLPGGARRGEMLEACHRA